MKCETTHSFNHLLTYSLIYSLLSLTHSLTHWSFAHSLIYSLLLSLLSTLCLTHPFNPSLWSPLSLAFSVTPVHVFFTIWPKPSKVPLKNELMIESTLKSRCGAESWTDVSLLDTYWPLKSQLRTGRENVHAAIFNTTAFILLVPCLTRDRAARIKKKEKRLWIWTMK